MVHGAWCMVHGFSAPVLRCRFVLRSELALSEENGSAFTNAAAASNNPNSHRSQKRTHLFFVLRSPTPAQPATT